MTQLDTCPARVDRLHSFVQVLIQAWDMTRQEHPGQLPNCEPQFRVFPLLMAAICCTASKEFQAFFRLR